MPSRQNPPAVRPTEQPFKKARPRLVIAVGQLLRSVPFAKDELHLRDGVEAFDVGRMMAAFYAAFWIGVQ